MRIREYFRPLTVRPPLQEILISADCRGVTQQGGAGVCCHRRTEKVVVEAIALGCNLIVTHHPLLSGLLVAHRKTYWNDAS